MFRISLAIGAALVANCVFADSTLTLEDARRLALEKQPSPAVRREVTSAWLSAWAAARTTALVRSLQAEYRRGIEAATAALAGGRGTLAEVYAARQLLNQSEDRLLELAIQSERSTADLARWTGDSAAAPSAAPPHWRDPAPLTTLLARLDAHPQRAAQRAELQAVYSEWRRSRDRLADFDARILPDGQAQIDALAVGYAAGRSDLGGVLAARRALMEERVRRVNIELAQAKARAVLEQFEQSD